MRTLRMAFVAMLCVIGPVMAVDCFAASKNAGPVAAGERPAAADPDCPTLPRCPNGLGAPLPPTGVRVEKPDIPTPAADGAGLRPGSGKYRGMVHIPAGPFDMGSPEGEGRIDEHPRHRVFVKDFHVSKHEVTVQQYCDFLNAKGNRTKDGFDRAKLDYPHCPIHLVGKAFRPKKGCSDKPMVCVSWTGAADYAMWAGARLPSAAEWEKAAALTTPYPPGDFLSVLSRKESANVRMATPGVRGVTGMIGNVWDWCSDWYAADFYKNSPESNPVGPALGETKVIRGGSWASPESSRRVANRHKASPKGYYRTVGFRVVKD